MENQNKQNYSIKIDMLKLNGAFMRNLTGRTTTKQCIIIPVEDNPSVYLGEKGCYLSMSAFDTPGSQYGNTHMVKPDIPKEIREQMTEDQNGKYPYWAICVLCRVAVCRCKAACLWMSLKVSRKMTCRFNY